MKKMKKTFIIFIVIILVFILFYFGLYIYAKLSPKLPINGANGYHLYDNLNQASQNAYNTIISTNY